MRVNGRLRTESEAVASQPIRRSPRKHASSTNASESGQTQALLDVYYVSSEQGKHLDHLAALAVFARNRSFLIF